MRLFTNFEITMSHQSKNCYVDKINNPAPEYPSVKEDQIDALTEKLKAVGIEVDRKKSEKRYSAGETEVQADFDETVKGTLKELVFVSNHGVRIEIRNYHCHNSDGRMGGFSTNVGGIEAHLVYEGSDQQQGDKWFDQAKKVVKDFYQPMCKYKDPEGLPKLNFKRRASIEDYGKPEK